jgi:ferredoxin-nitrite reductase
MTADHGFTEDQKHYLEAFIVGIAARRGVRPADAATTSAAANPYAADPMALRYEAQDRAAGAGGKLAAEEVAKREKHPFDMRDEIAANMVAGRFPKGPDVFRYKFHGLFYVAPNQDAFMLRLRLPGGILLAHQVRGLADIAERYGGGYVDITTRANLQIREIGAAHPTEWGLFHEAAGIGDHGRIERLAGAARLHCCAGTEAADLLVGNGGRLRGSKLADRRPADESRRSGASAILASGER